MFCRVNEFGLLETFYDRGELRGWFTRQCPFGDLQGDCGDWCPAFHQEGEIVRLRCMPDCEFQLVCAEHGEAKKRRRTHERCHR